MPGMGALFDALVYGFEASGNDWVGEVVLAALEGPMFGSPGSKPLQFGGESRCGHNSPSLPRSIPVRAHSKSVRVLPFPELDYGDWVCGSSWSEWVARLGCFGVWVWFGGRGRLECGWTSFGPMKGPWVGEDCVMMFSGVSVCGLCASACMVPFELDVGVGGRGQLDEGGTCMLCMGVRGCCEIFVLPSTSTSSQVVPTGSPDVLKVYLRTDSVAWDCNSWTLVESVHLAWECEVGTSRGMGLPRCEGSDWLPRGRGRLV